MLRVVQQLGYSGREVGSGDDADYAQVGVEDDRGRCAGEQAVGAGDGALGIRPGPESRRLGRPFRGHAMQGDVIAAAQPIGECGELLVPSAVVEHDHRWTTTGICVEAFGRSGRAGYDEVDSTFADTELPAVGHLPNLPD